MKSILTFALTLALVTSCKEPSSGGKVGAGFNGGKQAGTITLTTGNNNNLAPAGHQGITPVMRVVANASGSTVTGMDSSGAADGDIVIIRNDAASGLVTLTDSDSNSLTANQFLLPNSVPVQLDHEQSITAEYDSTLAKWVASSVGGAQYMNSNEVFQGTAHIKTSGTLPALTSCGTSPTIVGSDVGGTVVTGSAATTCTITFAVTYTTAPSCVFLPMGTATMPVYSVSATAITVATDIASTTYTYMCMGH